MSALKILEQGHVESRSFVGAWALERWDRANLCRAVFSAMLRTLTATAKDIWNSELDVFASIANYLNKNGWVYSELWGKRVKVQKEIYDLFLQLLRKVVAELRITIPPSSHWKIGKIWALIRGKTNYG